MMQPPKGAGDTLIAWRLEQARPAPPVGLHNQPHHKRRHLHRPIPPQVIAQENLQEEQRVLQSAGDASNWGEAPPKTVRQELEVTDNR